MRTFPIKVHYKVIEILAARWLGTWKKALFCSLKVHTLKKFATVHSAVKLLSIFLSALRAAQHGLYTSNLLPTPMNSHVVQNLTISLSLVPVFFFVFVKFLLTSPLMNESYCSCCYRPCDYVYWLHLRSEATNLVVYDLIITNGRFLHRKLVPTLNTVHQKCSLGWVIAR